MKNDRENGLSMESINYEATDNYGAQLLSHSINITITSYSGADNYNHCWQIHLDIFLSWKARLCIAAITKIFLAQSRPSCDKKSTRSRSHAFWSWSQDANSIAVRGSRDVHVHVASDYCTFKHKKIFLCISQVTEHDFVLIVLYCKDI
jgi:hypothetical protein